MNCGDDGGDEIVFIDLSIHCNYKKTREEEEEEESFDEKNTLTKNKIK